MSRARGFYVSQSARYRIGAEHITEESTTQGHRFDSPSVRRVTRIGIIMGARLPRSGRLTQSMPQNIDPQLSPSIRCRTWVQRLELTEAGFWGGFLQLNDAALSAWGDHRNLSQQFQPARAPSVLHVFSSGVSRNPGGQLANSAGPGRLLAGERGQCLSASQSALPSSRTCRLAQGFAFSSPPPDPHFTCAGLPEGPKSRGDKIAA